MYPKDLRYTKEHEWFSTEGTKVSVGITEYAQKELGTVVFVDLPAEGAEVSQGDTFAVVESVKAVSDIYSPVNGHVISVNKMLEDHPELINEDPYGQGWLVVIEMHDSTQQLSGLSAEEYREHVGEV